MHCDTIRDLLPLYADGLTSQTSNLLIEEHIQVCEECKAMLEQMCAPMETAPVDVELEHVIKAIHKRKKRNRVITLLVCVLPVLAALIGYWVYIEIHFRHYELSLVSTNPETILRELPELELTTSEKDLASTIWDIPVVHKSMEEASSSDTWVNLRQEQIKEEIPLSAFSLPLTAHISEIAVTPDGIYFDYQDDGRRVILEYYDFDHTGHVDMIRKCVVQSEIGDNKAPDVIYEIEYDAASGEATYKKYDHRRVWFEILHR